MDGKPDGRQAKKLIDAARYWARGSENLNDAIQDLKNFGAPDDVIQELIDQQAKEDFEVFPENWIAVEMFLRVQTQWRATYGVYYGLDYNVVLQMFALYEVDDQKSTLEAVQLIERSALEALHEDK